MRPPMYYIPSHPADWRRQIRRILEKNPGLSVADLALQLCKSEAWLQEQLEPDTPERLARDAEVWEERVRVAVLKNAGRYTEAEVREALRR